MDVFFIRYGLAKQPNTVVYVPFTLTFTMRPGQSSTSGSSPLPVAPPGPAGPPIGQGALPRPLPTELPPPSAPQVVGPITPQVPPNTGPAGHISGGPQPLPPQPLPPSALPSIEGNEVVVPSVPSGTQFRPRIPAPQPPLLPPLPPPPSTPQGAVGLKFSDLKWSVRCVAANPIL